MYEGHRHPRVHGLTQEPEGSLGVLDGQRLRFLDERIHEIRLPALLHLLPHPLVDLLLVAFAGKVGDHRPAPFRHGPDGGHIEVSECRQGEGPRDRRGRHQKHVGALPFSHDCLPLENAELVLLIDDYQAEVAKFHILG